MVNARQKGKVGEAKVKKVLDDHTGLEFLYSPGSGSGKIKGDIYLPKGSYCIEIENYAESPFNDEIFTNKTNNLVVWWDKLLSQSKQMKQKPLLIFKYNRSKLFVVTNAKPVNVEKYVDISWMRCYIMLLDDWLKKEKIIWQKTG